MADDYSIRVLRAPDGKFIVTDNPDVQLQGDCLAFESAKPADPVYIHLEMIYEGKRFLVWWCESREVLDGKDVEKYITEDRKAEVIKAFENWHNQPINRGF